ncbi:hypothetical protein [Rhodococcoides corynebacterioides]|uniref:Uncharacterized protein n=1 Tax=Rhodococcoides corynebacterioides TaxID=53972 RepID=A0ABS7P7S9_9NOCA|nr:hypothetical protein [Rhodococcus corynebacterioides]MBY6367927.1 hypothetical protein [Rhodococcus corynebacterioides]MBY6409445.1 hypothetical protein [Rhodococcus corynebacterioides]
MCDGILFGGARGRLAGLIRNGGRRTHRLAAEVERLDQRYRDATVEVPALSTQPWWNRRLPWL